MIHHFARVESTNTLALKMVEKGAGHGTVIHAEQQTGGRGRGGRSFFSPAGGLYFSLILRPELKNQDLPLATLAAGVGLCRAIQTSSDVNVCLKWPNDLYLKNRKLAGILTESGPIRPGSRAEYVIVGIGLNLTTDCSVFPSVLRRQVISLYHHTMLIDQDRFLQISIDAILSAVRRLTMNRKGLLDEWRALDYLQGRELEFSGPDGVVAATGIGLADDGRYRIRDHAGVEHLILAGDLNPLHLVTSSL